METWAITGVVIFMPPRTILFWHAVVLFFVYRCKASLLVKITTF